MRKAVLYLALAGCFLFALLLESVFTQSPGSDSETAAAVTLGAGRVIDVPEEPPGDWPPPSSTPGPRRRGLGGSSSVAGGSTTTTTSDPEEPPAPTPSPQRIVVESGDSLWSLAEEHLGGGRHFRELARWNGLDPDKALREGAVLRLQPEDTAPPSGNRIESHVVQRGESLSEIAERYLGSARAWTRIRDLNHLPNDRVTEGMVLRIPTDR